MPTAKTKRKTTTRKRSTRSKKDASSPIPSGPGMCGHESGACGPDGCGVRYVGPVSSMRDHHAMHAARGSAHIWAAAVTTGLALVLTGAIAYNAVEAKQVQRDAVMASQAASHQDVERILQRLDKLERSQADLEVMVRNQFGAPSDEEIFQNTLPGSEE